MEYQDSENNQTEEANNSVSGDVIHIERSGVNNLNGTNVTVRQGGITNVTAENLVVRQGGVVKAKTETLQMTQGGVVLAQTGQANLTAANAGVLVAGAGVSLDQSAARVLVAGGEVNMDQSASAIIVGNTVKPTNSSIVFLVARNVEGNVSTQFGPQESILFGAVAGLVAGVVMMLGGLFSRKRRRR